MNSTGYDGYFSDYIREDRAKTFKVVMLTSGVAITGVVVMIVLLSKILWDQRQ